MPLTSTESLRETEPLRGADTSTPSDGPRDEPLSSWDIVEAFHRGMVFFLLGLRPPGGAVNFPPQFDRRVIDLLARDIKQAQDEGWVTKAGVLDHIGFDTGHAVVMARREYALWSAECEIANRRADGIEFGPKEQTVMKARELYHTFEGLGITVQRPCDCGLGPVAQECLLELIAACRSDALRELERRDPNVLANRLIPADPDYRIDSVESNSQPKVANFML